MDVVAIAVTGASGLVGQRLLPRLADEAEVTRLIGLDVRDPLRRVRNLTFHRVEDWVVQGGDPKGTGTGGERVPSEYNDLAFKTGAFGIARGQDAAFNNDSQFFVVKRDSDFLNKQYTNFGQLTSGKDVVDGVKVGDKIKTIRVE